MTAMGNGMYFADTARCSRISITGHGRLLTSLYINSIAFAATDSESRRNEIMRTRYRYYGITRTHGAATAF